MLHLQTIDSNTLDLIVNLQKIPDFKNLRLVGGTSLALQLGHRKSIDIDLFGNLEKDEYSIIEKLNKFDSLKILHNSSNINVYLINGIKVDIVNYPYNWLQKPISEHDITLADKMDIGAMKLAAITGRGSKKDFIDLYFLLQYYSLNDLLTFYNKKYRDGSEFMVLKSLSYFDDADIDPDPVMMQDVSWESVKKYIIKILRENKI